ncbi:MAG: tRNA (guanosine(37)-N1)-methyltransferase TrmD [Candidatus Paceibacterota bacterium]
MVFHIITLFPEMFDSYLKESILARAIKNKVIDVKFYNPRDFVKPTKTQKGKEKPYLRVDEKPYGGGPGMVLQALPVIKTIENAKIKIQNNNSKLKNKKTRIKIIWLAPSGKQFTTDYAKKTANKFSDVIIICGRYEGIDERVRKIFKAEEISIGPFVVTGGEVPAMAIIDCVSRQISGVLGDINSLEESRVASSEIYTRPEVLEYKGKKYKVPKVLLSGNHKKIEEWRTHGGK